MLPPWFLQPHSTRKILTAPLISPSGPIQYTPEHYICRGHLNGLGIGLYSFLHPR